MIRASVSYVMGLPGWVHASLFLLGVALVHLALTHPTSPYVEIFIRPVLLQGMSPFDPDNYPQGTWAFLAFQFAFLLMLVLFTALFTFIVVALGAGVASLFVRMGRLRTTLRQIVMGYLEVALIFAGIYYAICLFFPGAIGNLHALQPWTDYVEAEAGTRLAYDIALRWVDCVHYSIVTQTTLGFGDMLPTTVATKLLTDAQALIGLFFIAVGIGQRVAK